MASNERLLPPRMLPDTLWDSAQRTLRLPPKLAQIYSDSIEKYELTDLASNRDSNSPPVGGLTKEATDQHFAQAFAGSVARAQLVLLDPKGDLGPTVEAALTMLAGNELSILDAPCGAAATCISFLATVAELRERSILPRYPLNVLLLGGEISPHARELADELLKATHKSLQEQAIFLEHELVEWDVTDRLSTTRLVKRMNQNESKYPDQLIVVANFNAFLDLAGKRKQAEKQLGEIFRYASGSRSEALWIEPHMNKAENLFSWIRKMIGDFWRLFVHDRSNEGRQTPTSQAYFYLPLEPALRARVKVALLPLRLGHSK